MGCVLRIAIENGLNPPAVSTVEMQHIHRCHADPNDDEAGAGRGKFAFFGQSVVELMGQIRISVWHGGSRRLGPEVDHAGRRGGTVPLSVSNRVVVVQVSLALHAELELLCVPETQAYGWAGLELGELGRTCVGVELQRRGLSVDAAEHQRSDGGVALMIQTAEACEP